MSNPFHNPIQEFVFYDKYSRFNWALGRRETWEETVDRAVDFLIELSNNQLPDEDYERIRRAIYNMEAMPSMRLLAMAGPAARRNNLAIYNCSAMGVDSLEAFGEALMISMNGCGVGFSVERQFVDQLPTIKEQTGEHIGVHVVDDSTEGWVEAIHLGVRTWFDGKDVDFDFSQIRPAGAILYTKGGRASGPEPLIEALRFMRETILSQQGKKLRPIHAHDIMCKIGDAAVSGGTRRTAMISLFDIDDYEMLTCKNAENISGNEQRWNANNSAVWPLDRKMTREEIEIQMNIMFSQRNGEPGIFNRRAAYNTSPQRRKDSGYTQYLTNPCVTADTIVTTSEGPRRVNELIGKPFIAVVNGEQFKSTDAGFFHTGRKHTVTVNTSSGFSATMTDDHLVLVKREDDTEWVPASELKVGDKIVINNHDKAVWGSNDDWDRGWLYGIIATYGYVSSSSTPKIVVDSAQGRNILLRAKDVLSKLYNVKANVKARMDKRGRWVMGSMHIGAFANEYGYTSRNKLASYDIEKTSSAFHRGYLNALFNSTGKIDRSGAIYISTKNHEDAKIMQRMLARVGVMSSIRKLSTQYKLRIEGPNIYKLDKEVGIESEDIAVRADRQHNTDANIDYTATVSSVIDAGMNDVYDCTIEEVHAFDANGLYVHNCGEISLRNHQLCNLTIAVARPDDTEETLREKVEIATIIGTIQSMATHFPGMRDSWRNNCEEERLLGVDITGHADCPALRNSETLRAMRDHAIETNRVYAEKLSINQSAAVTCAKPSGNSSQMLDTSPGIHARWSPYYIRNIRVSAHSPLYKVLRDSGVPMDPENGQTADSAVTWVAHFPVKSPEHAIVRNGRSAIEQLEYWKLVKTCYTEHNPSCTITYNDDEQEQIVNWVTDNQDILGGISFLPNYDISYDQMPYVEISKEEYEKLSSQFPDIDFSLLQQYELEDMTTAAQEVSCFAGACELTW